MKVMTWNVWGRFGPWERRQPAIASVIADVAPDVLALQEVREPDLDVYADPSLHRAHTGMGNAIVSRWPITEHSTVILPGDGIRNALVAHIDSPSGPLLVVATHLAHRFDQSEVRMAQVAALTAVIADERLDPETAFPPLLLGDLNAVPTSEEIRALTGESPPPSPGLVFTDAWAAVGDGPGHTWDTQVPYVADTTWPRRRLDYVLVGWPRPKPLGNPARCELVGAEPIDGVWPSDHLGVVATLRTP